MIVYEYPLNERIRTWLRIEDLFKKLNAFLSCGDSRSHHAALLTILELVEVMSRAELRSELIQELERQKHGLAMLHGNAAVDDALLDDLLGTYTDALSRLHDSRGGKLGQHIRDNEWLTAIKGRAFMPGGACGFDLPGYYYWLSRPAEQRNADLLGWLEPLQSIGTGVDIALKVIRDSGSRVSNVAAKGVYQMMSGATTASALMIRLWVQRNVSCYPEISANKYAIYVRFMDADFSQRAHLCEQDVPFQLMLCSSPT